MGDPRGGCYRSLSSWHWHSSDQPIIILAWKVAGGSKINAVAPDAVVSADVRIDQDHGRAAMGDGDSLPMIDQSKPNIPWYQRWGGAGFALGLRHSLRLLDFKIAHYDRTFDPKLPEFSEPTIGVFWHEYLSLLVAIWAKAPVTILVSQHRDAEWLNQAAERLGFSVVRGSTRRGGSRAVRQLRHLCKTKSLGIAPDGPLGPRRSMSLGPTFLASLFDMPMVCIGVGYRRPWRLNTWDRFAVPKPFSRARVIAGPKLRIPRDLRRDEMEDFRRFVQRQLEELTAQAEDWANSNYDLRGQMSFRRGQLIDDFAFNPEEPRSMQRRAA